MLTFDERIEAALEKTDIVPEFVSWYGGGRDVTIRIETFIGRYEETIIHPYMDVEQIRETLVRLSERFGLD